MRGGTPMNPLPVIDQRLKPRRAHSADPEAWPRARRVLAIRLDTLGDVLMMTPAIRALAESGTGRSVTLLTSPSGAEAARLVPEIADVIVCEAPWVKASGRRDSSADRHLIDLLAADRFEAAVIFTSYTQSPLPAAFACHLAGIPLRLAHCRENPYQLLTDWIEDTEPSDPVRHEVRRQLDLVASVGAQTVDERLSLRVPPEATVRVDELIRDELGGRQTWLLMHIGATASSRRYEHYAEVGRQLSDRGWTLVFTGGIEEQEMVDGVRSEIAAPTISLVGRLDLAELAALIARSPLLVSNNTGPVHVAAAVGTPVVDLYALTNPQHTPWAVPSVVLSHDVPCRNCYRSICPMGHHDCLRLVAPEDVVAAVESLVPRHPMRAPSELVSAST
jgi:lipopolysaccharide heptosyltransferase II